MHVLRIEHEVPDFDVWRKAFESDPLGRKTSGVLRHRIMRSVDDPNHVMIDLEFASADEAQQMHTALKGLWGRVDVMRNPHARAAELIESQDY